MKGKVVFIGKPKVVNDGLTTQQFAIEYEKQTKNSSIKLKMAFDQRKTEKYDSMKHIDGLKVGDEVEIQYNEPTSREHNGNWYTNVEAWSVKKEGGSGSNKGSRGESSDMPDNVHDDSDSLPF